ncbi:type III-B CRISPR module-associated protein Cmr5 [Paenibacillus pinihumi]|uniref:type III-B CRISPR module-associated protein Cmr5 n=1 Tax=Paenibacillus pinihumi TaxID=669462 RepID=UPI0006872D35|nr:type III-B CRISPR module-associated protein Cmr5 [Paenibacillus pinihumi]
MMKSSEHQYAEVALKSIIHIKESGSERNAEDYARVCHIFPSMVLLNGSRLTIAFFHSKGRSKDGQLSMHGQYLKDLGKAVGIEGLEHETFKNSTAYRQLTIRLLKAANWFKRYSEGMLKVNSSGE